MLIAAPWLGLLPAAVFLASYWLTKARVALAAGAVWLVYASYEYGMLRRWLCTGECNIRVDLLLIYPALLLLSVAGTIAVVLALARRRHRPAEAACPPEE
jgi:hypothetical protein